MEEEMLIVEKKEFRLLIDMVLSYRNELRLHSTDEDSDRREIKLDWINKNLERILIKQI